MPQPTESKAYTTFGLAVITLLLVAGAVYASRLPDQQKHQGQLVAHTRQVLNELNTLTLHVTEAESGQRGYLLTDGHESYLTPYLAATERINGDLDQLIRLTADDARQQSRLPLLREDIAGKLGELKETIDLHRQGKKADALRVVLSDRGRDLMTRIKQQIDDMKFEEVSLLQSRQAVWQGAATRARIAFLAGDFFLYMLIIAVLLAADRVSRQRKRLAEAEARAGAIQRKEAERFAQIVAIQRNIAGHSLNLQDAMQAMTERTQDLTDADGSIVEMLEGDEMVYRAANGAGRQHIGLRLRAEGSMSGLCVRENAILKCDDSEADARVDREACRKVGLRSMVVVPLRHDGEAIGVLKVMSSRVN
jgi:CHASE3 domain sensor protein